MSAPLLQNDKGQVPAEVVPDPMDMSLDKAEAAMVAKELKQLLLDAVPLSCNLPRATLPNYDNIPGNLMLSSLGLKLGDRVLLDDMKVRGTRAHTARADTRSCRLLPFIFRSINTPQDSCIIQEKVLKSEPLIALPPVVQKQSDRILDDGLDLLKS